MDFYENTHNPEEIKAKTKTRSAEWLKELEVQSWQAELVMSGLIITGLFQMPDLFIKWVSSSIIQSGEIEFSFLNMASLFFLVGIDCLIIFFGIHLLFRGIWIALLGLNSVYPNGIDVQSKKGLGEKYWEKAKEKYPDLTAYNVELDANCSLFFSMATLIIIMASSISLIILAFYQFFRFLMSYFPILSDYILPIGAGAYLIFLVLIPLVVQFLGKKYPDNKSVEKILMGYGAVAGSLFSLYIFRKPVGYINAIQTSNSKSKYGMYIIGIVSGLMSFVGAKQAENYSFFNDFEVKRYFTFNNKPHQILAFNYENLLAKDAEIYAPTLQSDVITDDFLKVFIPTIAREVEHINLKEYGVVERFKMNDDQREIRDKERLAAYQQFNRIYINNVEQFQLEYQFYTHPQAAERGLLVYVPSDSLVAGRNILEIRKNYFSKDSVQKIVKIPFFFKKG
ncbi:MAG: hypothetical protein U5L45_14250 [Saprospiraceae bacterium]|nr:hypothetical protein [Saprospiraceae bacterium]